MKVTKSLEKVIRWRLILISFSLLLACALLIDKSVHQLLDDIVIERLKQDAETVISAVERKNQGWGVKEEQISRVYHRVSSGHYFILFWDQGVKRSRSLWDRSIDVDDFYTGDTEDYYYYETDNETWVIVKQIFSFKGANFTLWVAEDISSINAKQKQYELIFIIVSVLCIFLFIFWQRVVLRNAFAKLKPVEQAIESNKFGKELSFPEDIPQEINGLVESIKALVAGSSSQLSRSRMALGNLAHELKKPIQELKIYSGQLQDPVIRQEIDSCVTRLQQQVEAELRRARISGSPLPGAYFNFADELPYLETLLSRIYDKPLIFSTDVKHDQIPFDRDDMLELFGNLLDNAWKYASSKVSLKVEKHDEHWFFIIEDDGPGIPEPKIAEANRRCSRVDEFANAEGHGLGLSICNSITEIYGGELRFTPSEMGGLKVCVELSHTLLPGGGIIK